MTTYRERHLAGIHTAPDAPQAEAAPQAEGDLDSMTKDELLAHAKDIGVSPANAAMTKDELRASIEDNA